MSVLLMHVSCSMLLHRYFLSGCSGHGEMAVDQTIQEQSKSAREASEANAVYGLCM